MTFVPITHGIFGREMLYHDDGNILSNVGLMGYDQPGFPSPNPDKLEFFKGPGLFSIPSQRGIRSLPRALTKLPVPPVDIY